MDVYEQWEKINELYKGGYVFSTTPVYSQQKTFLDTSKSPFFPDRFHIYKAIKLKPDTKLARIG